MISLALLGCSAMKKGSPPGAFVESKKPAAPVWIA
jgi:hypothetical protein